MSAGFSPWVDDYSQRSRLTGIYFLAMKTSIKISLPSRDAPFQLVLLYFLLDSAQGLLETGDVDTGLSKMPSVQSALAFLSYSDF